MVIKIECPHCRTPLDTEETRRLEPTACPRCKGPFVPSHVVLKEGRINTGRMGKTVRRALWAAFLFPPLLFGWLKFQGVDFIYLSKQLSVELLLKLSMALYYLSWSLGMAWETSDAESIYAVPPNRGRVPWVGFVVIGAMAVLFVVLCLVSSFKWLAPALAVFWAADWMGWIYLVSVVRPAVLDSLKMYEETRKYDRLENLLVFAELNQGAWKVWRYAAGVCLLVVIHVLAFTPLPQMIGDVVGGIPGDVVLAISVLLFILVMEGWIWFKRARARTSYGLIGNLVSKYDLTPKTPLLLGQSTPGPVAVQATSISS